jgi:predicted enzyme related to lactoylglutathione lyase
MSTVSQMGVSLTCITVDCRDSRRVAEFWAAALDWRVAHVTDDGAVVEAPDRRQPYLEFIVVPGAKTLKNRMHLGLSTPALDEQIARLVSMGAEVAWEETFPPEWPYRNVILRDPEGNEFCLGSTEGET